MTLTLEQLLYVDEELPLDDDDEMLEKAARILQQLRPTWDREKIDFKFFSNGISNKIFLCSTVDVDPSEYVVIRVNGKNTDVLIDRQSELTNWLRLSAAGCASPLLMRFRNGIACGYVPGETLTTKSVRDPTIRREICRSMAALHDFDRQEGKEPCLFSKLDSYLEYLKSIANNTSLSHFAGGIDAFYKQVAALRRAVERFPSAVVFCHNDLLIHNILYDSKQDKVTFIDYEYAGFNYQMFEIANHFCEYAGVENADFSLCPDLAEQRDFLSEYCRFSSSIASEQMETLLESIPVYMAAAHFFWAIWALIQANNSTIKFDYVGYAKQRHAIFLDLMREAGAEIK